MGSRGYFTRIFCVGGPKSEKIAVLQELTTDPRIDQRKQTIRRICSVWQQWKAADPQFSMEQFSSDAGGVILGATHRSIGLVDRFAALEVAMLVGHRDFRDRLDYKDWNDPVSGATTQSWRRWPVSTSSGD